MLHFELITGKALLLCFTLVELVHPLANPVGIYVSYFSFQVVDTYINSCNGMPLKFSFVKIHTADFNPYVCDVYFTDQ